VTTRSDREESVAPAIAGSPTRASIAPISCGRCYRIAFGSSANRHQHVFTIDDMVNVLRRYEAVTRFRGEGNEELIAEQLVVYEPRSTATRLLS
jgi:hypothetical protein